MSPLPLVAASKDTNQTPIVKALRAAGASVEVLSGKGLPDLLVGLRKRTFLLEVKAEKGPKGGTSGRNLTRDQVAWHAAWQGHPVAVVRTIGEALTVCGAKTIAGESRV